MLSLQMDPKLAWALAHPEHFPVDLNRAPREMLLRVPGLGVKAVDRLLLARRARSVRADDLKRLRVPVSKVLPYVLLPDHRPARPISTPEALGAERWGPAHGAMSAPSRRSLEHAVQGALF
jgi:predicted DNA-binding helix-hairpin-helix protein